MPNDPEKRKKINWELVVTAAAFCLALLAYLRPPDPAHPLRFDWLSHTVSVPYWLLAVAIVGIVAATIAVFRPRLEKPIGPVRPAVPKLTNADHSIKPAPVPADAAREQFPAETADDAGLRMASAEHVALRISRHEAPGQKGLKFTVDNDRLGPINQVRLLIYSAQSFDTRHQQFREGSIIETAQIVQPETVLPSCSGRPAWFLRKEGSNPHLLAADDSSHVLRWPENDPADVQTWKVSIGLRSKAPDPASPTAAIELPEIRADVHVLWNRSTNEFEMEHV